MVLIAFLLAFGCYGSVFSAEKDIEKYREMCETGNDGKACFELGYAYFLGKTGKVDYEKAYKYLKKSCKFDYGAGCYLLGFMYKKGYGIEKNEGKALELFKKTFIFSGQACRTNDANNCVTMGRLYDRGWGTKKDYAKAVEFYKKACDMGSGWGCAALGWMYKKGYGVNKDYVKAVELYKKA